MNISKKTENRLQSTSWFHGTLLSSLESIKQGVLARHNKSTSKDLDFGYGFYLTSTFEKAEAFITRQLNLGLFDDTAIPIVLEFSFCPYNYYENNDCTLLVLDDYDDKFAEFVFENRTRNSNGSNQHPYDMIYGVMSDSFPTSQIIEYEIGIKSKDDVLTAFKKQTSTKQLALHSQTICDTITLTKAHTIVNGVRKELEL